MKKILVLIWIVLFLGYCQNQRQETPIHTTSPSIEKPKFRVEITYKKNILSTEILSDSEKIENYKLRAKIFDRKEDLIINPGNGRMGFTYKLKDLFDHGDFKDGEYEILSGEEVVQEGRLEYMDLFNSSIELRTQWEKFQEEEKKKEIASCKNKFNAAYKAHGKGNIFEKAVIEAAIEKSCNLKNKKSEEKEKECVEEYSRCFRILDELKTANN